MLKLIRDLIKYFIIFSQFFLIITFLLTSISYLYASDLLISEIDFTSPEFVEIIKLNNSVVFNSSYFYVFDESEGENNTFSILHHNNESQIILIVGSSFVNDYSNYEDFNCSIYQTSGTQVGHRGMSSQGENFSIQFNENEFVTFSSFQDLNFNSGESLHFEDDSYQISNHSICELSNFQENLLLNVLNEQNVSINSTENNSNISNQQQSCELEIIADEIIENSKISFSFQGNISYGVTYSVLDGLGEIVRNPFTSSTSASKSYTPRKNGKFTILAEIDSSNCQNITEKEVYFYNTELDEDNDEVETISVEEDSFIEIHSVILKGIHQVVVSGEISRGSSSKYKVKFLVNDEEEFEFSVRKYGQFDFEIPMYLKPGSHTITIEGFGEKDEVDITMPNVVSEIEDELIVLLNDKRINIDSSKPSIIQVPMFNSSDFQTLVKTIVENPSSTERLLLENVDHLDLNENITKTRTLKTVFSQNIVNQNIGLSLLILSVVIICLVIIFKR